MNWHILNTSEIWNIINSQPTGLSTEAAQKRLMEYGPNELQGKKKQPALVLFLKQFKEVMILILMVAAIISGVIGELKDTIVILVIVLLNAIIGFVQEYRTEKAIEALKKMATVFAKVKRDGIIKEVPASDIVKGDMVQLEAGDMVPADMRLTEVHSLKIEEASLTGESQAVEKTTAPLTEEHTPLAERANMAYKNTIVSYGRGEGVVVATGMQTEVGKIAQLLQDDEVATPLQKRLEDFGKKLSIGIIAICVLLYGVGLLRGEDPVQMLLTAISLAVAAIPEALPAVITIALALGAKKMVKDHALIRKLAAVETLGSITYICTDKTGTLTQNKMTVRDIWQAEYIPPAAIPFTQKELFLFALAANQDTQTDEENHITGDSTEIALLTYAQQQSQHIHTWLQRYPRVYEMPFDADRKMMTTVHAVHDHQYIVLTKGALESILGICKDGNQDVINQQSDAFTRQGERVLAYSYKIVSGIKDVNHLEKEQNFLGLAGIIDPPRLEVKQAIAECKTAGIVPVMITGDHPITARVIAKELGIWSQPEDLVITGKALAELSKTEFEKELLKVKVYARVSPEQKLQIVKALQQQQQYVAMTGDGVNDAPALKRANIGIAMGITGTDVSKEAAHMILLDDNFSTIVKAIKRGRRIFDNIRKFIRYIMTGNSGEIFTIFLAPLVGLPIPLMPIQILWINLVTDGLPGLALANEPAESNIMKRPPRNPNESLFADGLGWHIFWVGLLISGVSLGIEAWAIHHNRPNWQTMVFAVLSMSQLFHVMAIRSENRFLFKIGLFSNMPLLLIVFFTFCLQLALIYTPYGQRIFSLQPLSLGELAFCVFLAAIVFHAVELEKYIRNYRKNRKTFST